MVNKTLLGCLFGTLLGVNDLWAMDTPEVPTYPTHSVSPTPEELEALDLDAPSGWLSLEIAILVDDQPSALASERWAPQPTVRYPHTVRWLYSREQIDALYAQHPEIRVEVTANGRIEVELPAPEPEPVVLPDLPLEDSLAMGAALTGEPSHRGDIPAVESANGLQIPIDDLASAEAMDPLEPITPGTGPEEEPGEAVLATPGTAGSGTASPGAMSPSTASPSTVNPSTGASDNTNTANPGPENQSTRPPGLAVTQEALSSADDGIDWLSEFSNPGRPQDEPTIVNAGDSLDDSAVEPAPNMPLAFLKRDTEQLTEGLAELIKATPRKLLYSARWVQPKGVSNLPIIIDQSGDTDTWPPLQGFIELRTGDTVRLGANIWFSTDGSYLPEDYVLLTLPTRAPKQIHITQLEAPPTPEVSGDSEQASDLEAPQGIEYIDPLSGLIINEPLVADDANYEEAPDIWPFTHLIHVATTETLPPNGVRYVDHPVLQIVATYRELSWADLFELGDSDARYHDTASDEPDRDPKQGDDLPPRSLTAPP